ncbi:30S ribosomal protein S2 [candidate division WWE3 bacterium CG08_land_8_20_14_0_20_40_13]|uniref:Small ribosomal subunit protein uS2 n=1 Tax=candidate division WWE3 bacterium CG08_land_8_20_14_0_20_40_13 TaxID=1975084 RepID=A0A2H0XGL1_UNCKA|nr:MAG: 30S ribosomal protein S2 [candidate division WWE3 bacterium CG08_land_8_20_14_0_20_40_13]
MTTQTKYKIPTPEEMLLAGLHIGHSRRRWHPKMAPFIFTQKNKIHIFDLYKTQPMLETACSFLRDVASAGGQIVFLGTKLQAQDIVETAAKKSGVMFVVKRWLGGTLSNFDEVKANRDKLKYLMKGQDEGSFEKYTKKERLLIARQVNKLRGYHEGVLEMEKMPQALFVVDAKREKTAVKEAIQAGIPVVALIDSNTNPEGIAYPIPGNDDAIKAIDLVVKTVAEAVAYGYKEAAEAKSSSASSVTGAVGRKVEVVNLKLEKKPEVKKGKKNSKSPKILNKSNKTNKVNKTNKTNSKRGSTR